MEQNEPGDVFSGIGGQIKRLRQEKRLSMRQLSKLANVTVSYISELESDRVSPTIATLRKVLVALGTDLGSFFANSATRTEDYVVRREAMRSVEDATRRYVFLLPRRQDVQVEFVEECFQPGESPEFEVISSDLAGYVVEGNLVLELEGEEQQLLRAGDAFYAPAGRPVRGSSAHKTRPVKLITVYVPPRY